MDEFDFINNIKKKYSLTLVGDDCAVLPKDPESDLLVSADLLVEEIDFKLDWTTPKFLGHKALAVSLSDIAAMGGTPTWALLTIGIPEPIWTESFLNELYEGWHELAAMHNVELAGGDISRTPNGFVIDSVVAGEVPRGRAILRSGARSGDGIYVSGPLGSAAAGLRLLQDGSRHPVDHKDRNSKLMLKQLRPLPRVALGKQLREEALATSMIDLSDGISSDLYHLCRASGTGAKIYADEIPIDAELREFGGPADEILNFALHGGEDFELLFTADKKKISEAGINDIFLIGEVTDGPVNIELIRDGKAQPLAARGYRHF